MQALIDWIVVGLRWAHIVAFLGWVGASLYFMWLESKLRLPDPARPNVLGEAWMGHGGGFYIVEKRSISPGQVPAPVYWFRIEAAVTWVTGFLLLVFVYYWTGGVDLIDTQTSALAPGWAIVLAIGLLVGGWLAYDGIWASAWAERNVMLSSVLSLVLLFGVVYFLCELFTGRAAFIHVGAILGTNMVSSVWTRIIPAQEEAVAATAAGRERNMTMAKRARRRALHNTYMTLPVILTMIAVHAPGAHSHPQNWLVLTLLIAMGIAARHAMILIDRREAPGRSWLRAAAPLGVAIVGLGLLSGPAATPEPPMGSPAKVSFSVVRGIIDLRCASCHAARPADRAYTAPPGGLGFDSDMEIAARAAMIRASVWGTRTMPPGNSTHMTEEERSLLVRWIDQGARTR